MANVVVTDTLPAGAILISASPDCQPEAGALICRPGLMPPSAARQLTATVRVDPAAAAGLMTNTATVGSRTNNDPNLTNDIATAGTTVYRSADLAVSKSYSPEPVMQRQPVYYTVAITNAGPSLAIAARLTDTLPAELENVTVTPSQGSCGTGAVFTCALGDLAPQASARVWVSATVQAGARWLTNTVSIGSSDPDPVPGDNEFTLAATVKQADLSITKTASDEPVHAGENLTYTLVITNAGPRDATGVTVTDTLPAGVTFVSATAGCALSGGAVVCNVGSLPETPGSNSRVLTVAVNVPSSAAHREPASEHRRGRRDGDRSCHGRQSGHRDDHRGTQGRPVAGQGRQLRPRGGGGDPDLHPDGGERRPR